MDTLCGAPLDLGGGEGCGRRGTGVGGASWSQKRSHVEAGDGESDEGSEFGSTVSNLWGGAKQKKFSKIKNIIKEEEKGM